MELRLILGFLTNPNSLLSPCSCSRVMKKWLAEEAVVNVRNSSLSLSPTLVRNEKVEHYIRIKIHKPIALRFWVKSDVNL